MDEKRYTAAEVSELRRAVENKYLYGRYGGPLGTHGRSRAYRESDMVAAVEEMVRTHMMAGHVAADLLALDGIIVTKLNHTPQPGP